jgi:hypothetical protein
MATKRNAGKATSRLPEISMETIGAHTVRVGYWKAERPSNKRPLLFFNGIGANMELAFEENRLMFEGAISLEKDQLFFIHMPANVGFELFVLNQRKPVGLQGGPLYPAIFDREPD